MPSKDAVRNKASLRHKEKILKMRKRKPSLNDYMVSNNEIYRKLKDIEEKEYPKCPSCDIGGYFFMGVFLWIMFK